MCGICGIVGSPASEGKSVVSKMLARLDRRGPDSNRVFLGEHASLGACRLAIIGMDDGHQPLQDESQGLVLVANAEIYNHEELRTRLKSHGHRFSTSSDCEVILKLYQEKGAALVHDLRGMFAFALLDTKRNKLILARDRLGEKPLYFSKTGGTFHFASEIGALIAGGKVPIDVDTDAVCDFFTYQYVPEPRTLLRSIRQVEAGHLVEIDTLTGASKTSCYWSLDSVQSEEGVPETIIGDELLAVGQFIFNADQPVGLALSGGLDSGIVAALAATNNIDATAITVGYEGHPAVDERCQARRIAKELGLCLIETELSASDVVEQFDAMIDAVDLPTADMAGPSYFALASKAQEAGLKVLVFGHGGDELFWGYRWLSKALASIHGIAPSNISRQVFYTHNEAVGTFVRLGNTIFDHDFLAQNETGCVPHPRQMATPELQATKLLIENYLRTNGIAQTERLCMAHGVEARLPFLDYRFVERVVGLRKAQDDSALPPKTWLRNAAADFVPKSVVDRKKSPFLTPTRLWHQHLFASYGERVSEGWLMQHGIVTSEGARRLATGGCGVQHGTSLSYKALVLETWLANAKTLHAAAVDHSNIH